MTAIYHPGIIETAPHYNIGAPHDAVNVLHWQTPAVSAPTTAELTAIQTAFDTGWKNLFLAYASNTAGYKGAIVTDMGSNTGLQVRNDTYVPVFGTIASPPMGDQDCVLISLKTSLRYRGGHGRIYLPGLAQTMTGNDGRTVAAPTLTAIQSAWTALTGLMGAVSVGG